jgi:hypothetical protein
MSADLSSYEHKPGAGKTLVSDPNTGQPMEVDTDDNGLAKMPEVKPTYRPSADEIAAAQKKNTPEPVKPTSGIPGVPGPNETSPNAPAPSPQPPAFNTNPSATTSVTNPSGQPGTTLTGTTAGPIVPPNRS